MEISSEKVLNKMEQLVQKAKTAPTYEQQQNYITAIKTLCELFSEEEQLRPISQQQMSQQPSFTQPQSTEDVSQKPMAISDANGSSLLDF